jgi:hypothetical protein
MWEPRHLTTLWAFMACYRDSFTFLIYKGFVNVRFITAITTFLVTIAMNRRGLTGCVNVSYVVGHERVNNLMLHCIVSIL